MNQKKIFIILSIVSAIGIIQGYFVAHLNHERITKDMVRVAEENKRYNKQEIDKLISKEGFASAFNYIDNLEKEYDEYYAE